MITMKKPLRWIFASLALGAALFLGVIWIMASLDEGGKEQEASATDRHSTNESNQNGRQEQTGFIGGIEQTIENDSIKKLDDALETLHKMTHQKVTAEDKWGAIPMTEANVRAAKEQISQLNIQDKSDLLQILAKWEREDFSQIDHDHNYFWKKQGGTIGKAYGIMTEEQEKEFIENNFGKFSKKE